MPDLNRQALIESFQSYLIQGKSYARINEARAQAEAVLGTAIPSGSPLTKVVDEAMEAAVVQSAREMIQQSQTIHEAFDRLVDLLERQPTLGVRSSTSVRQQAYSTPIPIAFLAASLAGVTAETTVYEPTAGHAALLLTTNPQQSVVNELNPDRVTNLRAQGYTVTENDATTYLPTEQVDVILANPPFGSVKENGRTKEWLVWGGPATPQYVTTQIDQTIALKALQAMKDDGRSVLILSAPMGNKTGNQADAAASYNSRQNAPFYKSLYDNYNVTQHFCIAGSLYSKQGTTFPIDVIVIEGRGKSARPYPAAELPNVYRSFADLKELLPDGDLSPVHLKVLDSADRGLADPSVDSGARASELERDSDLQPIPGTSERSLGLDDARDVGTGELERGSAISADPQYAQSGRDVPVGDARDGRIDVGMGRSSDDEQYGTSGGNAVLASLGLEGRSDTVRLSGSTADREWTGSDSNLDSRDIAGGVVEPDDYRLPQPVAATAPSLETAVMNNDIKQVPYQPQSQAPYAGTLVPTNLQTAVKDSLIRLEQKVGSIDTFVDDKVNLGTTRIQPFAEQIDSVALAIDNLEQGEAFILGDQTGIGKGLQLAEIAKAQLSGTLNLPSSQDVTLVFVTYDAKLYTDFLRDLNDVGIETIKPLVTNSDFTLNLPDGTKSKTGGSKEQKALLERLAVQQDLGDYNIVFTTYSQLQTVKGQETARRDFLRAIAPQSLFIFDESHNAGGTSNDTAQSGPQNRADFVRSLVQQAGGVVFSSATYAKNPYTMTLYASRTGMRHAVEDQFSFSDIVQSGGVPLQQMLAAKLAESGQYLRRERSFAGVEFSAKVVEVDKEIAQNMATVMSSIMEFDRAKKVSVKQIDKDLKKEAKQVVSDGSTGAAGASSTNFTSIMHNVIGQTLLALKAEETVQDTLAILRNNQKPVITLYNTMGSTIGRAAEEQDLKPGDPIDLSVGDLLLRYLERSRDVIEKDAFGDRTRRQLTDEELNPLALHLYEETKELIQETDWNSIPVSPIDYIRHRLEQEGYRTGEITGRDDRIEYGSDGLQTYQTRSSKERGTTAAIQNVAAFNAGEMDVIILNRSGSTGISLHASERFADQRSRHMLICQPDLDINQFMQTLGRIHRTGQVELPSFSLVMGDIAAEKRPAAVLLKKMASLNANTTAARDSSFSLGEVVDFLNEYGDQVAVEVMANHPDLHAKLGYPITGLTEDSDLNAIDTEGTIAKVTGRIPLLPLSQQERVYGLIEREYLELLERERAMGTSSLEAETVDLQAKTLARMEVMPAKEGIDSPFAEPAFLEIVEAKSPRKPLTALEVTNLVRQELGLPTVETLEQHDESLIDERAQQRTQQTIQDLRERTQVYRERTLERLTQSFVGEQENVENEGSETEANDKLTFKITQLNDKLNRQARTVEQWLEQFLVGQSVCLTGNRDGDFHYGVVQKVIDHSSEEGNPVAPSMWRLQIQVADATQQLIVPFSKINTESITGVRLRQEVLDWQGNEIINKFDEKQQEIYEQRQIFTGNVIRAAEQFTGKLINYTSESGEIHQGMLMARNFKIEEALEEQPVIMTTPEFCQRFLEVTDNKGTLKSADQRLSVMGLRVGKLALMTDTSKQKGGDYFLDEGLIAAAGAEFTSLGERMRLVVEADNVEAVLTYLYESHGKLRAFTHQDKARELMGLDLPTMETVEPQMQVSRIPTLESSAVPMQAEVLDVSLIEEANPGEVASMNRDSTATDEIATATIATTLGDLTVQVFEAPDDYLRLEFQGTTANWMEYPAQTRVDHLMRSDVLVMADGLQDVAAYAQFAVQQVHQEFVQHLDEEAQRITPALRRWLQQNEVGDSEVASAFMEHYPERDRMGLTPEFMQLAIQTVVQSELKRSDHTHPQERLGQSPQSEATVEDAMEISRILPSKEQFGKAEKTIAKFFDQTELAVAIFNVPEPEHEFHLRVENEPYLPLVIERHDDRLYFTHYREIESDLVLDGEMVFEVANTGHLKLCETAVQNPFTGWESRRLDKGFGAVFAQNIMVQGFVEATRDAWAQKLAAQETVDVQPKALEQADLASTQETFTIGGGIVYEVNEGEVSYQGLDPTHPQYPRPAEQPSLAVPVPVLSQPQPATSSDSVKTSQAVVPPPDEAPVVLATEPALAQSFQELQAKYPHYAFEQSQLAGMRYSDTHLWLKDEHGSHVGSVNVTVTGDRLSYQQADELIQRHEEKLQRPELVVLRAEFPQLRFEDHLVHMGRVVTAIDKSDGKHVATGIAEDEQGSTPERLKAFKQQLREAGYGLQAAPVRAADQTISSTATATAEVVTLTAFAAPLEAEVSPESLRETELVRGQEILDVAARAFAYGEAIGALALDEHNEFWTVPSTNYDISYNPENDNFFVVGKAGSEMTAQTIGGDLDPDCTGGITEADSQAFKDTASALDQISYHTQQSPSETVELAQAKLEQAAAPMPVAAVSASEGEHSLFNVSQYASTPLPATPYMVDPAWAKLEAASSSTQSHVAAQTATADSGNQPAEAQKQSQEPITLNDVRNWYRQARDIGRSDRHLEKIEQIGKAFRQGEALSDRDTKAMAKDGSAWCEQALTIAQQARDILQSQGEPTDSGNGIVYEGKTYTVFACQDHLYALAKGRGVEPTATDRQNLPLELLEAKQGIILKVEQGEPDVRSTRVTNADAHRFEMIANRLQRQEQRLESGSNRLHVVGYDR